MLRAHRASSTPSAVHRFRHVERYEQTGLGGPRVRSLRHLVLQPGPAFRAPSKTWAPPLAMGFLRSKGICCPPVGQLPQAPNSGSNRCGASSFLYGPELAPKAQKKSRKEPRSPPEASRKMSDANGAYWSWQRADQGPNTVSDRRSRSRSGRACWANWGGRLAARGALHHAVGAASATCRTAAAALAGLRPGTTGLCPLCEAQGGCRRPRAGLSPQGRHQRHRAFRKASAGQLSRARKGGFPSRRPWRTSHAGHLGTAGRRPMDARAPMRRRCGPAAFDVAMTVGICIEALLGSTAAEPRPAPPYEA